MKYSSLSTCLLLLISAISFLLLRSNNFTDQLPPYTFTGKLLLSNLYTNHKQYTALYPLNNNQNISYIKNQDAKVFDNVVVRIPNDPDMLNPLNYTNATSEYIIRYIFQTLLSIDENTNQLIPILAKSKPDMQVLNDSALFITYEIRPEARWDNGKEITAKDIDFSLKAMNNPFVNNFSIRHAYEFIDSIIFFENNKRKFTLVCSTMNMYTKLSSGSFPVLPSYIYDPDGLMDEFTFTALKNDPEKYLDNKNVIKFAQRFNSLKHQVGPDYIKGSGPYKYVGWDFGHSLSLKRKKSWWGDEVSDKNKYFQAFPPFLVYKIIKSNDEAIKKIKEEKVDVMYSIAVNDFLYLKYNTDKFNFHSPDKMGYSYIGINLMNPILKERKVRKALAHLINIEWIINNLIQGYAVPVTGPLHPVMDGYNDTITPFEFNIRKAKDLLKTAGWTDQTGNGILDKKFDGELVPFKIELSYNIGNYLRKAIGQHLKENAESAGIKVMIKGKKWDRFREDNMNQNYDLFIGGWLGSIMPFNPFQKWHTESIVNGLNYTGFGNAQTDQLIEKIIAELNEEKRNEMFKKLHWKIFSEVPYIFLYSKTQKNAIHKRFRNAEPSIKRPGFYEAGFQHFR